MYAQLLSHVWLCNPMDSRLPASAVHGISQARMLEWIAIPFSRGSSQPRDWTHISCIAGGFFTVWATREHTPVFLPGESHGQRSLAGCSPWGLKESDVTEWLTLSVIYIYTHTFRMNHYSNVCKISSCVDEEVHMKSDHIRSGSNNNVIRTPEVSSAKFWTLLNELHCLGLEGY